MSERFAVSETPLSGLYLVERRPRTDARGWLERIYDSTDLVEELGTRTVAQVNRTLTRARGTVRGLHYQLPPAAEAKIVSCLRGSVFDVAVDLRRHSPTFLRWHAETLDPDNRRSLLIPEGFAHGFQTLVADCELLYIHTSAYAPASERGMNALDPRLGIEWPLSVVQRSERDAAFPHIGPEFAGVEL